MTTRTDRPAPPARFGFGDVPVAEARPAPTDPGVTTRVVVGVDDSPASLRAVQWAGKVAPLLGTDIEIEVVIVVGYPEWAYDPAGHDPSGDARNVAQGVVHAAFGSLPPATLHIAVEDGDPVTRLLRQAHDAALLVVGSRLRRDGVEPPDSVGLRVAALAACPVLVIH